MALNRIVKEVGLIRVGIWQELLVVAHDFIPSREYAHVSDIPLVVIETIRWNHDITWVERDIIVAVVSIAVVAHPIVGNEILCPRY